MAELTNMSSIEMSTKKEQISIIEESLKQLSYGNISYLSELYNLTSSAVYGFALSIVKNEEDAKDILQDCYLQIHKSAYQYKSKGKPMAWILTITRNLALQKLNDRNRNNDIPIENMEYRFVDKNEDEDLSWLYKCLNQLQDQEREIVTLHAISGLKHREIAKVLKIPLATTLSKYHRALKKLKTIIEKENEND